MPNVNRRNLIKITAITAAAGTFAASTAPGAKAKGASSEISQLSVDFHARQREADDAEVALNTAIDQARAAWPVTPENIRYRDASDFGQRDSCPVTHGRGYEGGERQIYCVWTSSECASYLEDISKRSRARREWEAMARDTQAYESAGRAVKSRFDVDARHAAEIAARAARDGALKAVVAAPVSSLADLVLKAAALSAAPVGYLMLNARQLADDVIALGSVG